MTDPSSLLVVCRQRLDVLEQQAKAATPGPWKLWAMQVLADPVGNSNLDDAIPVAQTCQTIDGKPRTFDADHIASWSPAAVLALCGWIRQTLDGAEATVERHSKTKTKNEADSPPVLACRGCNETLGRTPGAYCSTYDAAVSTIAGLAAVLAPERAVK